ncbi:MAG: ATP-binding protein [Burkholderiaceae bacterium]
MASLLQWDVALGALVVLVSLGAIVYAWLSEPLHPHEALENSFFLLPSGCLLAVGLGWLGQLEVLHSRNAYLLMLAAHGVFVAVALFLLACANLLRTLFGKGVMALAVLGTVVLGGALWMDQSPSALVAAWVVLSLVCVVFACAGLVWKLKIDASAKSFLLVAAGLWGLGLMLDGLLVQRPDGLAVQAGHFFYFAYLFLLWQLFTERVQWVRSKPLAGQANGMANGTVSLDGLSQATDLKSVQESVILAVTEERQRIAQDIHDGVGSHLVGLIASLDPKSSMHRRIMMGLECCLLDLKMTIDSVDNQDANIFDALGRLRYRLQPSLDRAGIKMLWKVDFSGPLVSIRPQEVTHLVHIVQECLANVLQHSEANKVQLLCRYEAEPEPRLRLEVQDNGKGIDKTRSHEAIGKGLSGMHARARQMGVSLHIGTQQGVGTRVRVYLPLRTANAVEQA